MQICVHVNVLIVLVCVYVNVVIVLACVHVNVVKACLRLFRVYVASMNVHACLAV